jgi:iron complex transport system substrate-binding protein
MRERRRRLAGRLRDLTCRPRVLYWAGGFTAGRGTTIDDVIREAGGINVAAEMGIEGSPAIAPERVVAVAPEVLLLPVWKAEGQGGEIESHPILRRLDAVRERRVVTIEGRYLTSVSQFVVEGAERLARKLHPGRFPPEVQP